MDADNGYTSGMSTKTRPRGQPPKYPWAKWIPSALTDGPLRTKTITLQRGRDFECQPHGMAQMIRNRISRRGYSLVATIDISERSLVVTLERKS